MADERALTRRIRRLSLTENRYEPYQVPRGRRGARISDGLSYLKEVEEIFSDQRENYDKFIRIMKEFKNKRMSVACAIARVKELFRGHTHLIFGFNYFLPDSLKIGPTDEEDIQFEEAIMLFNKVKIRFRDDDQVYKSFRDIFTLYRMQRKGIHEVCSEVAALFMNHPDLFDEFMRILPRD